MCKGVGKREFISDYMCKGMCGGGCLRKAESRAGETVQ